MRLPRPVKAPGLASPGINAKPPLKKIQRQIDTGADSSCSHHVTFINDFVLYDFDRRKLGCEHFEPTTVRRRPAPIEQTGSRQ